MARSSNPADIISTGTNPDELAKLLLWVSGPDSLSMESNHWPTCVNKLCISILLEVKKQTVNTCIADTDSNFISRYSCYKLVVSSLLMRNYLESIYESRFQL